MAEMRTGVLNPELRFASNWAKSSVNQIYKMLHPETTSIVVHGHMMCHVTLLDGMMDLVIWNRRVLKSFLVRWKK